MAKTNNNKQKVFKKLPYPPPQPAGHTVTHTLLESSDSSLLLPPSVRPSVCDQILELTPSIYPPNP
jgi:hypothetical protein